MQALMAALREFWLALPPQLWVALYGLWIVAAVLFILQQRRPPNTTLAWIIAFMSLPFIGALVYFFFGPRKLKRRRMRRVLARSQAARFAPGAHDPLPPRLAGHTRLGSLARLGSASGDGPPRACQWLALYDNGDQTYEAIVQAIAAARSQVHLEYYIFEPDAVGTRIRDALVERARAGVKVRMLVDALGSANAKARFWAPLLAAGGELRQFNPPRLFRMKPGKLNFRTHRKIVIVDGLHAFTGGINVSAGNSALSSGSKAWRDTHLGFSGAPAQDLQVVFLEDWLFAGNESVSGDRGEAARRSLEREAAQWFPEPPQGDGPWVQIIDSGPDEPTPDIQRFYFAAIATARQRVWITTPYFVPDEPIMLALITAAARGVDVRIIVPQVGDSRLVTAAASTFADEAAAHGVPVFEYQRQMIHAKTMVVDDDLAVVGTANLDNRSFRLNFEVIAAIYDRDTTTRLAGLFEQDLTRTRRVDPQRGVRRPMRRMMASVARLLAPIL